MQAKASKKQVKKGQPQEVEESKVAVPKKPTKKGVPQKEETFEHPPPKRPSTAWIFFNTEVSAKLRAEGTHAQAEIFKLASEAWNKCSEEEKAPYEERAAEDKLRAGRQAKELAEHGYYTLEDGSKSTDEKNKSLLKVKKKRGKGAEESDDDSHPPPKRACSAWTFYNTEAAKEYRAQGKGKEAFKLASEKWATMSEKEKAPYVKMAEADKAREEKEKAELAKKGYYTLSDGTKSTDPANVKLLKVKKKRSKASQTRKSIGNSSDSDELDVEEEPKPAKTKQVKGKARKE